MSDIKHVLLHPKTDLQLLVNQILVGIIEGQLLDFTQIIIPTMEIALVSESGNHEICVIPT